MSSLAVHRFYQPLSFPSLHPFMKWQRHLAPVLVIGAVGCVPNPLSCHQGCFLLADCTPIKSSKEDKVHITGRKN
jgi:hypothetical protein